jgi:hypothetical protein
MMHEWGATNIVDAYKLMTPERELLMQKWEESQGGENNPALLATKLGKLVDYMLHMINPEGTEGELSVMEVEQLDL